MIRKQMLEIVLETDRFWASGVARRFAAEQGFSPAEQSRLALCVAELASNLVKHACGGRIELSEIAEPSPGGSAGQRPCPSGCRVLATDAGPGIADVEDALQDGFSEGRWLTPDVPPCERRGLGTGLGAVCRLMSEVRILPRRGGGVMIEAVLRRAPGTGG